MLEIRHAVVIGFILIMTKRKMSVHRNTDRGSKMLLRFFGFEIRIPFKSFFFRAVCCLEFLSAYHGKDGDLAHVLT